MKHFLKLTLFPILVALLLTATTSCTKKPVSKSATLSSDVAAELHASAKHLKSIPTETSGFFQWDTTHASYKRLQKSAWYSSDSSSLGEVPSIPEAAQRIISSLGLDLHDRTTWDKLLSKGVLFVTPQPKAESKIAIGVVFESAGGDSAAMHLKKLKESLKNEKIPTKDEAVKGGTCFSVQTSDFNHGKTENSPLLDKLYIAWGETSGIVTTDLATVEHILNADEKTLPTLLDSKEFKRSTADFPSKKNRYGIGYLDIKQFASTIAPVIGETKITPEKLEKFPIKAASWALAMESAPSHKIRLLHDDVDDPEAWLSALHASKAEELLNVLPANPIVFLSLDGEMLKHLRDRAIKEMGKQADPSVIKRLAFLDSVKRVGLTARVAAPGQSLLPVPDISLVLESSEPQNLNNQIAAMIDESSANSGIGGLKWREQNIAGTPAKVMLTPFGVGVHLANKNNFVVATSSPGQMQSIVGAIDGKGTALAKLLPSGVKSFLATEESVSNLYLNFEQVGSLLENMGGLMSMYVPQDNPAQSMLAPESVAQIKQMGLFAGAITLGEGTIDITSFYQPGGKPT